MEKHAGVLECRSAGASTADGDGTIGDQDAGGVNALFTGRKPRAGGAVLARRRHFRTRTFAQGTLVELPDA
ncbi:MAG TPA: hypothetical protein VN153_11035, partial [Tahibacter sp.]|nr:hypothetical protein [Tahibacter sp.]